MNRFTTLIAAGSIAAAAAATSLPAYADEYYVVHPDGVITRQYTGYRRDGGYSYFYFSFGGPVVWFQDSHRHHHRNRWAHEWRERWQHERRHHRGRGHSRRSSGDRFDDDDWHGRRR
jgi:hypothetical protein